MTDHKLHNWPRYGPFATKLQREPEETATKEVQIIVRGGMVECIHNWPDGLPGAVYDYDNPAAEARCPIEELIEDADTNPGHVLINTGAFDWLIAKAMKRA